PRRARACPPTRGCAGPPGPRSPPSSPHRSASSTWCPPAPWRSTCATARSPPWQPRPVPRPRRPRRHRLLSRGPPRSLLSGGRTRRLGGRRQPVEDLLLRVPAFLVGQFARGGGRVDGLDHAPHLRRVVQLVFDPLLDHLAQPQHPAHRG